MAREPDPEIVELLQEHNAQRARSARCRIADAERYVEFPLDEDGRVEGYQFGYTWIRED